MASIVVRVSNAVLEDFQRSLTDGNGDFRQTLRGFYDICDYAITAIEKVQSEGQLVITSSAELDDFYNHLCCEKNAYDLMLKMLETEDLRSDLQGSSENGGDSFLRQLFEEDSEFRRIATLLHWSEEISYTRPQGFSHCLTDMSELHSVDNVHSYSIMEGRPTHLDMEFTGKLSGKDDAGMKTLKKYLFAFLRCGRLEEAKRLLEHLGLPALTPFISMRQLITNPVMTPNDPQDDAYYLARSRAHFKKTARDLLTLDNENITLEDRCLWATLCGSPSPLLSHAATTEDRLWVYLSSAVEELLDRKLLAAHADVDEEMAMLWQAHKGGKDRPIPLRISAIFTELRKAETGQREKSVFYALYSHLASANWKGAVDYIEGYVESLESNKIHPHLLRFLLHLVLLLKATSPQDLESTINADELIERFTEDLISVKLLSIVPFYLSHLSPECRRERIISFLQGIEGDAQRNEVLTAATEANLDKADLCRGIYAKSKAACTMSEDTTEEDWNKLVDAWGWLTYSGGATAWEALLEATNVLRKLFLYNRMEQAERMLSNVPQDLAQQVSEVEMRDNDGAASAETSMLEARHEFECYLLYFECISRYTMWMKHVHSEAPSSESHPSLDTETGTRMDISTRSIEDELSMSKAQECMKKFARLGELLKKHSLKRAVELLRKVLCMQPGWLCQSTNTTTLNGNRIEELQLIRDKHLYLLISMLLDIHAISRESSEVLKVSTLLVDPRYGIDRFLSRDSLRKLTSLIATNGGAALLT